MKHIYYIEIGTAAEGWQPYRERGFKTNAIQPTFNNMRAAILYIKDLYRVDEIMKNTKYHYRLVDEIGTVYTDFRY